LKTRKHGGVGKFGKPTHTPSKYYNALFVGLSGISMALATTTSWQRVVAAFECLTIVYTDL